MTETIHLYPQPRSVEWLGGASVLTASFTFHATGDEARRLSDLMGVELRCTSAAKEQASGSSGHLATRVQVEHDPSLHSQGYVLEWSSDGLSLVSSTEIGLHYALVSFEQLIARQGLNWPHFRITDEPDFSVRGVMLDIGRNKIPKMATLYALIDRLAELKINHLQLYMEGFCFDYEAYRSSFPDATPISAAEFRELDAYAASRYIDLVPNQNGLGHMAEWLAKPEFRELAEHPGGMPTPFGYTLPATTLNPIDPRSIELVKQLFDELLPNFSSNYVNINMDEPFGLGMGQSKSRAEEIGVGRLYLEYVEEVIRLVRSNGKKTLMWGDIITKHPDLISLLPDDVTVLDWNYESHTSFKEHGALLQESGIPYYVCPGTSAWASISGRTDNMLANVADAAQNGKAYGAGGLVVTDWGDSGHWQVMPVSMPGYVFAAGVSWQVDANLDGVKQVEDYLSDCVYRDRSGEIGKLLLELGRYEQLENSTLENMTYTNYLLNRGVSTREKLEADTQRMIQVLTVIGGKGEPFKLDFKYDTMMEWLRQRKKQLGRLQLELPDAEVIIDELANTIQLIEQGAGLHRYVYNIDLPDAEVEIAWLEQLKAQLELTIAEFARLWRVRNREGGLARSIKALAALLQQYEEKLQVLKNQS